MLERLSIRWRIALVSAAMTLLILLIFAIVIGTLTASRIRSDFDNNLSAAVGRLADRVTISTAGEIESGETSYRVQPPLRDAVASESDQVRIFRTGQLIAQTRGAPDFPLEATGNRDIGGYRVQTRYRPLKAAESEDFGYSVTIQYARKTSDPDATIARVRLFLLLGVLGGTGLALAAGLVVGRRAMKPVAELTATASEIARTRDTSRRIPPATAHDEVGELAATLDEMLRSLEASRSETESALARQRQFVADASHELRTPLTSVLSNLELLAEELVGEHGESVRAALRSSRRMRRLVADLLLLARADSVHPSTHYPTDLAKVAVEAAAELGAVAEGHQLTLETEEVMIRGAPDELHRMALNLMENAVHHTPPGTHIEATVKAVNGQAVLSVTDDGPGISDEVREHLFERFVRAGDDRAGSFGLGLSIVSAVATSHGGSVTLEEPDGGGTQFVVRLPRA